MDARERAGRPAPWRHAWTLLASHPRLSRVRRWGVSVASLVSGTLTLFVFRRGLDYFPWFIGYLILAWLAGVTLAGRRQFLAERGHRAAVLVVEYTVQSLLHGLLLFLLPIYYASTTLASGNGWLLVILAGAAVLTTIDPWYRAAMRRARWLESAIFALACFASLGVAFPLIGVPSGFGLPLGGVLGLLALAPVVGRAAGPSRREALVLLGAAAVAFGLVLWQGLAWLPPVPLHVPRLTFATGVQELEPLQPVSRISVGELRANGGIVAFSAVVAPAGLRDGIQHVWRKDGKAVDRIVLAVMGGRPAGFRTFSRKVDLGPDPVGQWRVDVLTLHGQLLGRARMTVTPDPPTPPDPAPPAPRS